MRRQRAGAWVTSALRELRERATSYREDLIPRPGFFDPAKECGELRTAVGRVRDAVAAVDTARPGIAPDRDRTAASLDALQSAACGKTP